MNKTIYFIIFLLSAFYSNAQYISVDENYTVDDLVKNVLFSNSCSSSSVTNISVSGGNFGTSEMSWGYFNANGSSFPFQDGIILSTGKINNAIGPNDSLLDDGDNMGWNGDNDLNQALGLSNTFNATVLEFDFTPISNQISFDFILSSEQYLTNPSPNQCNYTDGFAFLIKEINDVTYENIALVPNTNIPIKINTVRGEGTICPSANEEYFDAFNGVNHPTNFNGQTKSITARTNVIAGNTYHIKLVVADEGNYRYDSAIFLKGGSFTYDVNLGDDRTIANGNPICYDEVFSLDATSFNASTYQWFFNGNPIPGATNPILNFTPPYNSSMNGDYSVIIDEGGSCERNGSINLEFTQNLSLNDNTYEICDSDLVQDGITDFSSTDFDNILTTLFTNLPSNYDVAFFENPNDTTPISFPYSNSSAFSQIVYAKITNFNCYANDAFPIYLTIKTFDEDIQDVTIGLCSGSATFLQAESGYTYLWDNGETTSSILVNQAGTYSVILTNANSCSRSKTFYVVGSEIAIITNVLVNDFSYNNTAEIQYSGTGDYEFSLDGINYQESPFFNNLEEGEYTVYINDKNGCGISNFTFFILNYPKFFTPNNDGYNDTWNIKNLDKKGLQASKIFIFDRYGKLLKQISPLGIGWNGTYNGYELPSEDYWFILELTNGKNIKGHFALKR